ncbi:MAG: PQQ-binding-like beta-propeller repeat protein [Vicinamibacterales bacterium]
MTRTVSLAGLALAASWSMAALPAAQNQDTYWAQWRGPLATGVSPTADPPTEWSEAKNVRWKIEIPGRGSGTPVVWGDRLFVLSAVPTGVDAAAGHAPRGMVTPRLVHRYVVMAVARKDGAVLWQHTAREAAPTEGSHQDNGTFASSSAVTDGQHVIASFESQGLYAYDMNGKPVWSKDLGDKTMRNEFGEGSTPVLHGRYLVVVWGHQGESFIVALDKATGAELWRVKRDEIDTWATPLVVEHAGKPQVVTAGMNKLRSYDLATGAIVWEAPGVTMNPIPSPVAADGMVFVTSGFRGNSLRAIDLTNAKGAITSTPGLAWSVDRDTPYVPSPLLHEGIIYFLKTNSGVLTALDAKTGKPHYQVQRLEGVPNVFSSPVAAAGRIYIVGREGTTAVIKPGPGYQLLGTNTLGDHFDASPALVEREMYLRGVKYLYCLAH